MRLREAVAIIQSQQSTPFFLYLAFNAVHTPMEANDARLKKFAAVSDPKRRTYAAMMSAMDDAVGQVVETLRETKQLDNTLIMFISDNGGPTMPNTTVNASRNDPLRGSKRTTLEGGIRVPFLVYWTGHVPAGGTYERPVIQLDFLPTALAAAGVTLPEVDAQPLDGVDLMPYLTGANEAAPHETLYWRFGPQMAIRRGDLKLVRYDLAAEAKTREEAGPKKTSRISPPRLYNLADDIGESRDLASARPTIAVELQALWDEWDKTLVPPLWGAAGE